MLPSGRPTPHARLLVVSIPAIVLVLSAGALPGAQAGPNVCNWLTPAKLLSILGHHFDSAEVGSSIPAYPGQAPGTTCDYGGANDSTFDVHLLAYVHVSAKEARATFDKVAAGYFNAGPVSGIGDEAYLDRKGGLHVLAGKVRFYVSDDGIIDKRQSLTLLAGEVIHGIGKS